PRAAAVAMQSVAECAFLRPWQPEMADEIRRMRQRMEQTARPNNLKRGPGTLDALAALHKIGALSHEDLEFFGTSYRVLLAMVSRLRLMNTTARHDLPEDHDEQVKLARLLEYPDREKLLIDCEKLTQGNRSRFARIFAAEGT